MPDQKKTRKRKAANEKETKTNVNAMWKNGIFYRQKRQEKGKRKRNIVKDRNTEINSASEKHLCKRESMIQKVFSPSEN